MTDKGAKPWVVPGSAPDVSGAIYDLIRAMMEAGPRPESNDGVRQAMFRLEEVLRMFQR